jgi:transcriptional regulator of nitric oxide reductase
MQKSKFTNAAGAGGEQLNAQPLTVSATNGTDNSSDWLRLPRPRQRLWGLSRTSWNELCESGAVKSITLRKAHAQRGIKLIFRPSAESYLKSLLDNKEVQS